MRICLLSQSAIGDDPRVRRQGDALAKAGHDVVAVGFPSKSEYPSWPIDEVQPPATGASGRAAKLLRLARIVPALALRVYWSYPVNRDFLAHARAQAVDVFHANDWTVLPVAVEAARSIGADVIYDSHEFAVEENIERLIWRMTYRPYIRALEMESLPKVARVITVGDGIADLIQAEYDLDDRPLVVRNTPPFQVMPYREPGEMLTVLYHGVFNADRGLDLLIRSVGLWRPGVELLLRGRGSPEYEAYLRMEASHLPDPGRVRFVAAAPMLQLVELANASDVGIHPIPGKSGQTRYCLPNKFFEYVMAGLALCVSDVPEMASLVKEYDLGVTIAGSDPRSIAAAVNALDPSAVARFKRNALKAARELSWDTEGDRLLEVYREIESARNGRGKLR